MYVYTHAKNASSYYRGQIIFLPVGMRQSRGQKGFSYADQGWRLLKLRSLIYP